MWIADYGGASVAEIDLRTGQTVADIHVGGGPAALAVGLGGVWVANSLDSTVSRINPLDGSVAATIPVGSGPSALLLNNGLVWVANQYAATVSRIDPAHDAVVGTASVGGGPAALAADAGKRVGRGASARPAPRGHPDTRPHAVCSTSTRQSTSTCCRFSLTGSPGMDSSPTTTSRAPTGRSSSPTSRSTCRRRPTAGPATPSACGPAFATPTAGSCARRISGSRSSVCSAFGQRKAQRSTTSWARTLARATRATSPEVWSRTTAPTRSPSTSVVQIPGFSTALRHRKPPPFLQGRRSTTSAFGRFRAPGRTRSQRPGRTRSGGSATPSSMSGRTPRSRTETRTRL